MTQELKQATLGAGRLFFDPYDADGDTTGEREMGDASGVIINSDLERIQAYDSTLPTQVRYIDKVIRSARSARVTLRNIVRENVRLFFLADDAPVAQAAVAVVDEALTVKQDRYYQLGVSDSNPTGVRGVTAVTVTNNDGTTTYTADTDYTLDAALGRLYIKAGGAIADDSALKVDYTPEVQTRQRMSSDDNKLVKGALRWISNNDPAAANTDLYAPHVTVIPDGDYALLQNSEFVELGLSIEFLKPANTKLKTIYLDGRPS